MPVGMPPLLKARSSRLRERRVVTVATLASLTM